MLNFDQRLRLIKGFFCLIFAIFAIRLFDLQILQYDYFYAEAKAQHEKRSILPARRGKIFVRKNRFTKELMPVATNNTLKRLFVDPFILAYPKFNPKTQLENQEKGNPKLAAQILAPLLIHGHCEEIEGCEIETDESKWTNIEQKTIQSYTQELTNIFSAIERTRVVLAQELTIIQIAQVKDLALPGIWVEGQTVFADPTSIFDISKTANTLSDILLIAENKLEAWISRRPKRYVAIMNKIVPEVSERIIDLKNDPEYQQILRGIQLRDEHWRYYPEKTLASQVIGFLDSDKRGQYGIEGYFDHLIREKEGYILGDTTSGGQRIFTKNLGILRARDGHDLILTIDRVIQDQVEKILDEDLEQFDADFGQIIVVEPSTGKILAMANAPGFDPNEFGKIYLTYEVPEEQVEEDKIDPDFNFRIPILEKEDQFYKYFNTWGPAVFRNKLVSDLYEPGSVMKAVTMAAALNSDEVTPQSTYDDTGPVEVDEFKIRNSDDVYSGETTMLEVLNRSLNTGIAFITKKMGRKMLYDYLIAFGFKQFSNIDLGGEVEGRMKSWQDLAESELVTYGFGQGLTATPLQMAMAFAALANGGYLMKPMIVEEIRSPEGEVENKIPEKVRRVISGETSEITKSMLLNSVDHGVARGARVFGYSLMGKTGTSQTYKNGKALEGEGTTITSFAGFGPFEDPRFVILVKYDYPKTSQWGSETAALTFKKVATFLFDYLRIVPDR